MAPFEATGAPNARLRALPGPPSESHWAHFGTNHIFQIHEAPWHLQAPSAGLEEASQTTVAVVLVLSEMLLLAAAKVGGLSKSSP